LKKGALGMEVCSNRLLDLDSLGAGVMTVSFAELPDSLG